MIKAFKAWLKRKQNERFAEEFRRGYDWVAGSLLRSETTEDELEIISDTVHEAQGPFDLGIRAALRDWMTK
jgi:hypothetical protein